MATGKSAFSFTGMTNWRGAADAPEDSRSEPPPPNQEEGAASDSILPGSKHDVWFLGYFTVAFADSFNGLLGNDPSEEQLKEAFSKLDTDKNGKIDMTEAAEAMRELGYSERQVQGLMDSWPTDREHCKATLDFQSFQDLMVRPARPYTFPFGIPGYEVPMPNIGKVLDTPVLGQTMTMTGDIITRPYDDLCRSSFRLWHAPSDDALEHCFNGLDEKKTGKIGKKEVATGLRMHGFSETSIQKAVDAMPEETMEVHDFKRAVRGQKFSPGYLRFIPLVGNSVAHNLVSEYEWPVHDVEEVCAYIDKAGTKKLDKTQVAEALRELGFSEFSLQKKINSLESEPISYDDFKALLATSPRPWTQEVFGLPVPNPGKIHDVPVLGTLTSLTQDAIIDSFDWTAGALSRTFSKQREEDLKLAFSEMDSDKDGCLTKAEFAKVMRSAGQKEWQIKRALDTLESDKVTFDALTSAIPTTKTEPVTQES
mmetsp:Transcript_69404/g.166400  ORF Transcript_69404/g.166400 Transcript_69404/m.166400 type:complete len:481 (+) Transcript_69404:76-1518(+)